MTKNVKRGILSFATWEIESTLKFNLVKYTCLLWQLTYPQTYKYPPSSWMSLHILSLVSFILWVTYTFWGCVQHGRASGQWEEASLVPIVDSLPSTSLMSAHSYIHTTAPDDDRNWPRSHQYNLYWASSSALYITVLLTHKGMYAPFLMCAPTYVYRVYDTWLSSNPFIQSNFNPMFSVLKGSKNP